MFRREINGEPERFSVVGLWGSGNVVGDRAGLLADDLTAYTMWDGHALFGPLAPSVIEKFPAFVFTTDWDTFAERYAGLGQDCTVWVGEETLGVGCSAACLNLVSVCDTISPNACLTDCAHFPRPIIECMTVAKGCAGQTNCGQPAWGLLQR